MRIILIFGVLFSLNSFSQTKDDFKIITPFKDTLFTGYDNALRIESKWDLTKVIISATGLQISAGTSAGSFIVRATSIPKGNFVDIVISYRKSSKEILKFSYPFFIMKFSTEFRTE